MHNTLSPFVRGYINVYNDNKIEGWLFYIYKDIYKADLDIRVIEELDENYCKIMDDKLIQVERPDVSEFYKNILYIDSGFEYTNCNITKKNLKIQMLINNVWETVFEFKKKNYFSPIINRPSSSLIIVDNFYNDPDMVREFALKQEFKENKENKENKEYHKGRITEECFRFKGLKSELEFHMNKNIINWSIYETNGCFQLCITSKQLVYHYELQEYVAIICLTPDEPLETYNTDTNTILCPLQTDLVDKIGNVYNRLLIFDAKLIHSISHYFGNNCGLFHIFFFDVEN
jgi:hypothetical protein